MFLFLGGGSYAMVYLTELYNETDREVNENFQTQK